MKNHKLENICLGVLAGAACIMIAALMILTVVPPKRSHKGEHYNFNCVTQVRKNPLAECKESGKWTKK